MKKERKLKLEVNKVSIATLNRIKGGDPDPIGSVVLCALTTEAADTMDDDTCKTGITIINDSDEFCVAGSGKC